MKAVKMYIVPADFVMQQRPQLQQPFLAGTDTESLKLSPPPSLPEAPAVAQEKQQRESWNVPGTLSANMSKHASLILSKLREPDGSTLNINELGQIVIYGQVLRGSSIADILKYLEGLQSSSSPPPAGINEVLEKLAAVNTPAAYVTNQSARQRLQNLKHHQQLGQRFSKSLPASWIRFGK